MLTRRTVLQLGAYSTALVWVACRRGHSDEPATLLALTGDEYATMAAACERILPSDDDPGAIDLGVPAYIDRALAGDRARWRDRFRAGLAALDHHAGKPFSDASTRAQDNVLDDWQDGSPEQQDFIHMLVTLTFEGAFGDPSYGGNRDGLGWRLIGFAPSEPRHHG